MQLIHFTLPDGNSVLWIVQPLNTSQKVREAVLCVACKDRDQHCGFQKGGLLLDLFEEMVSWQLLCARVQEELSY